VNIWTDIIFKVDAWLTKASELGVLPALIGNDLHSVFANTKDPKFLALAVPVEDPDIMYTKELFLQSLQSHFKYNEEANEIWSEKYNLVINIAALNVEEEVVLRDPTKLFKFVDHLSTTILYFEPEARLQDIGPDLIGGL
ncbi:hypothetical protein EDB81DRAFT_617186, partial [Dactylonectria macrodidyma]